MQQNEDLPSEYHASDYRNPTYDQHAKRLLAQRTIMARLLKRTVPEFKDVAIADIAEKYIEGSPQISEIPVARDKTNAARNALHTPKEFNDLSWRRTKITRRLAHPLPASLVQEYKNADVREKETSER